MKIGLLFITAATGVGLCFHGLRLAMSGTDYASHFILTGCIVTTTAAATIIWLTDSPYKTE